MSTTAAAGSGATNESAGTSASTAPKSHRITIKSVDMADERKDAIIAMAEEALDKSDMEKDVAESLKRHCDMVYGNTWHCVVGKNFGSYVTHETKNFIYFTIDSISIMLWKTS